MVATAPGFPSPVGSPTANLSPIDSEVLYLVCEVTDTGCGLTAQEKEGLFQRFHQVNAAVENRSHVANIIDASRPILKPT